MQTRSTLLVVMMMMMGVALADCVESKTYLPPEGFELRFPRDNRARTGEFSSAE